MSTAQTPALGAIHDDFDAAMGEAAGRPIYSFTAGGRDWVIPSIDLEAFASYAALQESAETEDLPVLLGTLRKFVGDQLPAEDRDEWDAVATRLPLGTVMKIAQRLCEAAVGGLPFAGSPTSGGPSDGTGGSSSPGSSPGGILPPPSPR